MRALSTSIRASGFLHIGLSLQTIAAHPYRVCEPLLFSFLAITIQLGKRLPFSLRRPTLVELVCLPSLLFGIVCPMMLRKRIDMFIRDNIGLNLSLSLS